MLAGLSFALLNSVLLAGYAAVYQRVAKRQLAILPFCALASVLALALSLPMVRWGTLLGGGIKGLPALTAAMAGAGMANAGAVGLGVVAWRRGHSAVTFAVTQSAMAVSFLYAVLGWGERASAFQMAGLASVIGMLCLVAPWPDTREQPSAAKSGWFAVVLAAVALGGIAQVCYITPSRWAGWQDAARLRVPLFMAAMTATFAVPSAVLKQGFRRDMIVLAGLSAFIMTGSLLLLLMAIDRMAPLHQEGLVYPVTIAAGLLLYTLYSRVWLREAFVARQWWGILAGVGGIVLLCIR